MGVQADVTVTPNALQVGDDIEAGLVRGLNVAGERLLALTLPVTPKVEGTLRGTGSVIPATTDQAAPTSSVTFDGPQAARLHEHPEYNFTEPGTGGKYLENTALQNKKELGAIIAAEVRRA